MLRLILGTDWIANRNEVLRLVSEDVKCRRKGVILMVPELISHDTERRLCAAAGDTASRYAEVLSFTRLLRRVAETEQLAVPECLDGGGRLIAMASAARMLSSRLKSYASVETRPEFLSGLIDAVDEFKRCRITPEDLMAAAGQTEPAAKPVSAERESRCLSPALPPITGRSPASAVKKAREQCSFPAAR